MDTHTSTRRRSAVLVSFGALTLSVASFGFATAATAAAKVPVGKVGATCAKSNAAGKTAKGTALVCKKTGTKLKWALAPKKKASADTTVPSASKKTADTTVPAAAKKVADTTIPAKTTAKPADTTIPKK
jgi:hypothetical protein